MHLFGHFNLIGCFYKHGCVLYTQSEIDLLPYVYTHVDVNINFHRSNVIGCLANYTFPCLPCKFNRILTLCDNCLLLTITGRLWLSIPWGWWLSIPRGRWLLVPCRGWGGRASALVLGIRVCWGRRLGLSRHILLVRGIRGVGHAD